MNCEMIDYCRTSDPEGMTKGHAQYSAFPSELPAIRLEMPFVVHVLLESKRRKEVSNLHSSAV